MNRNKATRKERGRPERLHAKLRGEKTPRGRGRAGEACEGAGRGGGLPHTPVPGERSPLRPRRRPPQTFPHPCAQLRRGRLTAGPGGRLRPWQRGREGRERDGDGEGAEEAAGPVLSARGGGQEGGEEGRGLPPRNLSRRRARPAPARPARPPRMRRPGGAAPGRALWGRAGLSWAGECGAERGRAGLSWAGEFGAELGRGVRARPAPTALAGVELRPACPALWGKAPLPAPGVSPSPVPLPGFSAAGGEAAACV